MLVLRIALLCLTVAVAGVACSERGGKHGNENGEDENGDGVGYTKESLDLSRYQDLNTRFPIQSLERFSISGPQDRKSEIFVAEYVADDQKRRAIVYPSASQEAEEKTGALENKSGHQYRQAKWQMLFAAIEKHGKDSDRVITYWDNAQRLHLFTGRMAIPERPSKEAYSDAEPQSLWREIGGGFSQEEHLTIFAQCLIGKMDDAKSCLSPLYTDAGDNYILISADDMAHVQEISRLIGQGLPLETRLFSTDSDLHGQIRQVREWAREGEGTGSYMVQPIDEDFVRAWRITDPGFEDSLLASLLPFTSAAEKELINLKLVFQSDWGGYLSLYQIVN